MKYSAIRYVSILLLLLASNVAAQQLSVRWGLDGPTEYYAERPALRVHGDIEQMESTALVPSLRYFATIEPAHNDAIFPLSVRTSNVYAEYVQDGGSPLADDFLAYLRETDRYTIDRFRMLAPRLYFDFTGHSQIQYILEGITVEVFQFEEYAGGGFADLEYAYDLVLVPRPGRYYYSIDRRLRFTGSGRTTLTFFSDNFYPSGGLSPMGLYEVNLIFKFLSNGNAYIEVETGPFRIDV